jgi:hypothetical protein
MKSPIAAGVLLSLSILNAPATPQDDAFQKIARDYIEQYLQTNPEDATELGDHRFDSQLTDYLMRGRKTSQPKKSLATSSTRSMDRSLLVRTISIFAS